MSDEVRRIEPEDDEIAEEWVRLTDEPEIHGVEAYTTGEDVTGHSLGRSADSRRRERHRRPSRSPAGRLTSRGDQRPDLLGAVLG
ncbi:MAG: hypothetical protein ACRDRJ_24155 [Streptosporangiaceae bacterium]